MKAFLPWILAVGSGLALALAMPGPGLTALVFVFPILLLEAIERTGGRRAWLLGWVAGAVFWSVTTNWVVPVMHHYGGLSEPLAAVCLAGMGGVLGVLWALAAGVSGRVGSGLRIWLFPAAWIASGVLQRFPPFGFAWAGVAEAVVDWPWLMRSLPVWGASGLGWCVAALGAGAWGLARRATRGSGVVATVVAGLAVVAAVTLAPRPTSTGGEVAVAVVQPGTTLEEKWDPTQADEIAGRVWSMTAEAALRGADLVLWPESAMPYDLERDPVFRDAVESFARELDIEIVVNAVAPAAGGGWANSAYLVKPSGVANVRYDKVHLVPFGEYVPAWARLAFTESLVREVGAFTPGRSPVLLPAAVPLGVAICFEVVFPDLVAQEVRSGAQLLSTLTNDGWYGYSWAPLQHFAQVRVRAAETQRWFARAALTGISGFVDPLGRVVAHLEVGESGVLVEPVQPMTGLAPKVRWGDWWAALCAVAAVLLVLGDRRAWKRGFGKRSNIER
jgi:apolipoprotein N-acyltransferase